MTWPEAIVKVSENLVPIAMILGAAYVLVGLFGNRHP